MTPYFAEAEIELNEAAQFYENRQPGLGTDFLRVIDEEIHSIEEHPHRWPVFSAPVRRCLVHKFPDAILYLDHHGDVIVVAIAHLSRNPTYWLSRISNTSGN